MRNPFKEEDERVSKRLMICGSCSILFGIFLIIFGVSVKYIITDQVVQSQIYLNLDLKEGTETWDAWVRTDKTLCINWFCKLKVGEPLDSW